MINGIGISAEFAALVVSVKAGIKVALRFVAVLFSTKKAISFTRSLFIITADSDKH